MKNNKIYSLKMKRIPVAVVFHKPLVLRIQDYIENKLYAFCEPKRKWIVSKLWTIWAKTLGHKISSDKTEADLGAVIRTLWVLMHTATCIAIILGVIRHWNG
jgi:hypothetical protein